MGSASSGAVRRTARDSVAEISIELARQVWTEAGRLNLDVGRSQAEAELEGGAAIDALLNDALERCAAVGRSSAGAPARWYRVERVLLAAREATRSRCERVRQLAAAFETRGARRRGRGRQSRAALFVQLMFQAEPGLPRAVSAWLALDDAFPVDPVPNRPGAARRKFWEQLLRRHAPTRKRGVKIARR